MKTPTSRADRRCLHRGVQNEGVIATVKHFAANNQEYDRHNVSSDLDERTLREIYLPAFEAAVQQGHVGAVMNSYNLLNGTHATENKHLNLDILEGDWKFDGVLMSDWDATYSSVGAANNGLDLEMPSGKFMNPRNLLSAVKKASSLKPPSTKSSAASSALPSASASSIETGPILPSAFQPGRPQCCAPGISGEHHAAQDDGNLLPLDPGTVHPSP